MIKTGIWGSTLGLLQCKAQWGHHNKAEYQPPSLWGTRGIPNPITTLGASLAPVGLCHANQSRQQHCQWHHQQWGQWGRGTPQSHWCPLLLAKGWVWAGETPHPLGLWQAQSRSLPHQTPPTPTPSRGGAHLPTHPCGAMLGGTGSRGAGMRESGSPLIGPRLGGRA